MQTFTDSNKLLAAQLPKNLIANILYFIINVIIGILLIPYFISTLGVAAYGLIPLATSITGYVGIVVQSLNVAVTRFLTVDLQREDYAAANRTFNTAIFGLSTIIIIMAPIATIIAYSIPGIFNVPSGEETDVVLLFIGVFAAFLISSWSGNFTVQLFAYNRLDLQNIVNSTNVLVQTGFIVLFFKFFGPNLALIGIAYVAGAISSSILAIIMAKRVCPHLKVSIGSIDLSRLKDLSSMGWWSIISQIGTLLFLQIDLIVVNLLFGATSAGQYAVVLQWAVLLRGVANMISGVLTPMVLIYYAKEEINTLTKMVISAVKFMGLFMALPIGFICGFTPQILTVWVGKEFAFMAPLLILMVLHLTINLAVLPIFSINYAYNKILIPGSVTLLMGGGNLILAIVLPLLTGWGFYGVAAAGAIVLTLKNAIFTPWYATRIMGINPWTFTRSMIPGIVIAAILSAIGLLIGILVPITSLVSLILIGCAMTLVYFLLIWKFSLSKFERGLLRSYLPASLGRLII
jgi:membrane protein EpsK